MKAYISVNFAERQSLDNEIAAIIEVLDKAGITPIVFVDHYKFDLSQEREMMKQAMTDIDRCDIIIAETSHKGIGIGVEVGYAKARGKPIIYMRGQETGHSTTVSGISDFQVIYANSDDLKHQLFKIVDELSTPFRDAQQ
jgi:2'-deoxynucleoside 5'-phosphate N-hydrolase